MLTSYKPKNFGKEYVAIKGSAQYPMFVATALGVKPSYDDWIDVSRYDEFVKMCKDYELYVEPDVVFVNVEQDKEKIIGGENIATTFAVGKRFDKEQKQGQVHVFVSKSKKMVLEAKKFGWYPVVINGRSINKPFVDHLRFGKCLGFPDCCVDFFRKYNDWHKYNHPYEIYKNTPSVNGKACGSYLCNNHLMDSVFFFIHHLPCSYRCEATIEYAKKVEEKILEIEPEFVKKTIGFLKKPLLVFGEKNFVIFDGKLENGAVKYFDSKYFKNYARPEDDFAYFDFIKKGNKILFDSGKLIVMKNNETLNTSTRKKEWFMIDWD